MFMTCYKVVIDPRDFEPVLVIYTTARRSAKMMLRRQVGDFTIIRTLKTTFFRIPMWQLCVKFPTPEQVKQAQSLWPRKVIRDEQL